MQRPRCARATGGNDIPDALVPGSRSLVQKMGSTWEDWGFELRASGPLILKSNMPLFFGPSPPDGRMDRSSYIYLCINVFVCTSLYLFVSLGNYLIVFLYLFVFVSMHMYLFVSIYLPFLSYPILLYPIMSYHALSI